MMESREAAGEAIFAAIFEAAPSLQELFKTARAVHAMRFTNVLNSAMQVLDNPRDLKILAETVGFGHLNLEVTAPKGAVFRDSILDLFESELGDALSNEGRAGWEVILNYIIGACIYVRRTYAERLRVLAASWEKANNREPARNGLLMGSRLSGSGSSLGSGDRRGRDAEKKASSQLQSPQHSGEVGKKGESGSSEENRAVTQISKKQRTSFKEMFEA
ncbi:unnamed protein product [Prorocentrum cordatum]|uniref:Globin domain-containing protein n=1 Tax=Prorocentrum cordatum TaxID=2364126 RepID=A0ABN9QME0_9DINO|nr:unnamed protein product [Polarella glacialis]